MADTVNAANWHTGSGSNNSEQFRKPSSGRGRDADAPRNPVPIVEVDPKQPWSPLGQAASAPPGWYRNGIDGAQGFNPISDNSDNDTLDTGARAPGSILPPRLGPRLYEAPDSARGAGGIMSQHR